MITLIATIVGAIQSLLFSALIAVKRKKILADWILLGWFLSFSSHLILISLLDQYELKIIVILAKSMPLLHGPFLWFYTQAIFHQKERNLLHILPFVLVIIIGLVVNGIGNALEIGITLMKTGSLIAYPLFVRRWIYRKLDQLKASRSDEFITESMWLTHVTTLLIGHALLGITHVVGEVIFQFSFSITMDIILYALLITTIGFYGLKYRVVYDVSEMESPGLKYETSSLSAETLASEKEKVRLFFETSDAYMKHDFSLTSLSSYTGIARHHLSQIINIEMNTSFYDLVNEKRVSRAMIMLKDPTRDHLKLEAIGYSCGYNTKSAFFQHFKKITGKTPGQFKKERSMN